MYVKIHGYEYEYTYTYTYIYQHVCLYIYTCIYLTCVSIYIYMHSSHVSLDLVLLLLSGVTLQLFICWRSSRYFHHSICDTHIWGRCGSWRCGSWHMMRGVDCSAAVPERFYVIFPFFFHSLLFFISAHISNVLIDFFSEKGGRIHTHALKSLCAFMHVRIHVLFVSGGKCDCSQALFAHVRVYACLHVSRNVYICTHAKRVHIFTHTRSMWIHIYVTPTCVLIP